MLARADGVPAYNLAVVVDDAAQGVTQVVRGDDLLSSAPRQAWLATVIGASPPTYAHVPMVLNADHVRLSKRDGAVTLADLALVPQVFNARRFGIALDAYPRIVRADAAARALPAFAAAAPENQPDFGA